MVLTQPDDDILDNFINVEVFVDDDSIYIPSNVNIASKLTIINSFIFIIICSLQVSTCT